MRYLPVFASLTAQPCLVVGGGAVAERKVLQLLATGARVTVNATELSPALEVALADGRIEVARRPFDPALVPLQLLVIAATSDEAVNRAVADAARAALRLCNVVDQPALSTYISPSVVDRSPLLIAVSSGGQAPVLARLVRQRLERWLPARLGALAAWAGGWRARVKEALPDVTARRRLWEEVLAGVLDARTGPAQAVIDGRTAEADETLRDLLHNPASSGAASGEAWIVGAGPGDPGLITASGLHCLQHADVVLHDRLVAPALLAFARRDAELIDVGKTGGGASTAQARINALLLDRVRAGRRVCRLKGGDPYVFGRGSEEVLALAAAGLPFRVIPGITAASGCGAYAGIPLTHRHAAHAVTFVTAHLEAGPEGTAREGAAEEPDWQLLAALGQTLVVYMSGRRLAAISDALCRYGRPAGTPAAVVMSGTTGDQRVVSGTLGDIAAKAGAAGVSSPAILYVGDVVALRDRLDWFRPAADAAAYNAPTSGIPR